MNTEARMTLFSFLSYYDLSNPIISKLQKNVLKILSSMKDELSFSQVAWGPAAHKGGGIFSDSLVYSVKHSDTENEYTIVFRGTNPLSLSTWIFQDFDVSGLIPWTRESPNAATTSAYISKSADKSLKIHKNIISNRLCLRDWIFEKVSSSKKKAVLNFCGHSLGGMICSAFALYIHDELSAKKLRNKSEINVYAFAAPTAGNVHYAEYMNNALKGKFNSFANPIDIATLVWTEKNMISVLPAVYGKIKMDLITKTAYSSLCNKVKGLGYCQPGNISIIDSQVNTNLIFKNYIFQAAYQHIFPYLIEANEKMSDNCSRILTEIIKSVFLPYGPDIFGKKLDKKMESEIDKLLR